LIDVAAAKNISPLIKLFLLRLYGYNWHEMVAQSVTVMKFKVLFAVLAMVLGMTFLGTTVQAGNGKHLALVIGNQDYAQAGAGLSRPTADAEAVAAALKQHFTLLDGKVHSNLGKEAMETLLLRFAQEAAGADVALVYYAGHGVQDKNVNYLVPVDAQINSMAQIKYQAVDLGLVLDHLEESGTRLNLVFLDACRNNPFGGGRSLSRGLARITPLGDSETLISYSTSKGNVAADDSLYSPALVKLIQQQPNQPIEMMIKQVGAEVKQKSNNAQHPDYTSSITTAFCFGGCQQVAPSSPPVPAAPVGASPASDSPSAVPTRQPFEPEMVAIPAGKFTMGCDPKRDDVEGGCDDDEKPAHEVSISTFQMAKTEVTVAQFREFVKSADYKTTAETKGSCLSWADGWKEVKSNSWRKLGFEQGDDHPVACVSWDDAQAYVNWLKQKTGKNYRLPTEAEWEYAARGGTDTAYPWGNTIGKNQANCYKDLCGDKFDYTSSVGSFAVNPFGLVDMQGNVWEWVQDWKGDYVVEPQQDPQGASKGTLRVLRGGSWNGRPRYVRSADRNDYTPDDRIDFIGFRPAQGQ
jgi:formylglycine-generating enzyme required for sulfatase activity